LADPQTNFNVRFAFGAQYIRRVTRAADHHALLQYSKGQSPAAFEDLVRQYAGLVYTTARRIVGETHLAEDVTQATFIVLARKAHRIDPRTLPGWLVTTTRLAARAALRSQKVRSMHETKLAQLRASATAAADEPTLTEFLPLLDEALSHLNDIDRTAVCLRFLQGIPFAEIGHTMGSSEEAARKRVSRAVEKLRTVFTKKGLLPSTGGLMVLLATQQAKSAPAAVVISAATISTTGGTSASVILAKGVVSAMTWAKIKVAAVVILFATLAGGVGMGMLTIRWAMAESPGTAQSAATTAPAATMPYGEVGGFAPQLGFGATTAPATTMPVGRVTGDLQLLKTVALQNRSNAESIATWQGNAVVYTNSTRSDNSNYASVVDVDFLVDSKQDALRYNTQTRSSQASVRGKDIVDVEAGFASEMVKGRHVFEHKVLDAETGVSRHTLVIFNRSSRATIPGKLRI